MPGAGARTAGELGTRSAHDYFVVVIKDMQTQITELKGRVSAFLTQRDGFPGNK